MIKINLLPPEHRKVEGTPVARMATTVAGVFVVAGFATWWGLVHFGKLAEIRKEREDKELELKTVQAQAERSKALQGEYMEYQRRRDTIEKRDASRSLWSKKLYEL